jgi:RNA polymerase sigma factor (TIGR02999 family)
MEITELLQAWASGDRKIEQELVGLIYPSLRRIAARELARSGGSLPFVATEIAHEAYLKLVGQRDVAWKNRAHFFAIAARVMRRVTIDLVREQGAEKRGAQSVHIALDDAVNEPAPEMSADLLLVDQVLSDFQAVDAEAAELVELRFFGGMTLEEISQLQDLSMSTLTRRWRYARAWMADRMQIAQAGLGYAL